MIQYALKKFYTVELSQSVAAFQYYKVWQDLTKCGRYYKVWQADPEIHFDVEDHILTCRSLIWQGPRPPDKP